MRRGAPPSLKYRQISSKRKVQRESRWRTRQIRWEPCGGGAYNHGRRDRCGENLIWVLVIEMGLVVLVVRNSFPGVGGVDWTPDILGHALVCPGPCSKEKRAFAYTASRLLRGMLIALSPDK